MNDNIKEKLKMNIAISKMKNEEENIVMNKNGKFVFKNIGIAACVLMSLTGVVFAGNKIIESIWQTPQKIVNPTSEITEESKQENITEEQAKEIAINKLKSIGFNYNIVSTDHYKEIDSNTIMYRFYTEDNYQININGQTGEFYDIWNENKDTQDRNITITENEAKEIADKYYKLFGYKDGEYEITKVMAVNNEGTSKDYGFRMTVTYNKKYGEIYNPYETIYITIESKDKALSMFRVSNISFDNNETIITEEQAIKIALQEDEKIETNNIIETKAKKMIVKMNANAYDRINNTEKYYDSMQTPNYPNEERNYYSVDDRIRNAWVVVITYEDNYGENIQKRYTEGQYSYFVDCTTGEIIGGHVMDYTYGS